MKRQRRVGVTLEHDAEAIQPALIETLMRVGLLAPRREATGQVSIIGGVLQRLLVDGDCGCDVVFRVRDLAEQKRRSGESRIEFQRPLQAPHRVPGSSVEVSGGSSTEQKDGIVRFESECFRKQLSCPRTFTTLEHLPAGVVQFDDRGLGVNGGRCEDTQTERNTCMSLGHALRRASLVPVAARA